MRSTDAPRRWGTAPPSELSPPWRRLVTSRSDGMEPATPVRWEPRQVPFAPRRPWMILFAGSIERRQLIGGLSEELLRLATWTSCELERFSWLHASISDVDTLGLANPCFAGVLLTLISRPLDEIGWVRSPSGGARMSQLSALFRKRGVISGVTDQCRILLASRQRGMSVNT